MVASSKLKKKLQKSKKNFEFALNYMEPILSHGHHQFSWEYP